ncbi:MAG: hypothetical protein IPN34_20860 [Planctomycetes bacterium]|nr:hypothetical protein [Planctomycetota bacterium]
MTRQLQDLAKRAAARFGIPSAWSVLEGNWPVLDAAGKPALDITAVLVTPAGDDDANDGLLAFLVIEVESLFRIDGVTLRLTDDGRLALSFPSRTSRRGTKHSLVRPRDQAARASIERAIFAALGIREEAQR